MKTKNDYDEKPYYICLNNYILENAKSHLMKLGRIIVFFFVFSSFQSYQCK